MPETKVKIKAPKTEAKSSRVVVVPRSRKALFITLGAVAAILLLVLGVRWWLDARAHESTDDSYVVAHIHNVSARAAGTVSNVLVEENEAVKAGQILAQIDPSDYMVKVEQARAALRLAQQQAVAARVSIPQAAYQAQAQAAQASGTVGSATNAVSEAQARLAEAQAGVMTARAGIAQAQANLVRAKQDYDRYKLLVKEGAISQQQFEQAAAQLQVTQAQQESARDQLAAAATRVKGAQSAVASARANVVTSTGTASVAQAGRVGVQVAAAQAQTAAVAVEQAAAQLHEAELNLSYCTIVAPVAGRAGKRQVEVGQRVQPGQPIFAVVESAPWVEANFKETQLGDMRVGQPVEIEIDALHGRRFLGHILSLSPASGAQFALLPPENATGNFTKIVQRVPVRIGFDPKSIKGYEDRILPGMSTVVRVRVR
jgi:membrane fusion protein (multidrug efflux system)